MSTTRLRPVLLGALALVAVTLGAACQPDHSTASTSTSTTSTTVKPADPIDAGLVAACRTERASVITAYQAAHTSQIIPGSTDTARGFLANPDGLTYFHLEVGPTTGPIARTATSLVKVPETSCSSISTAEIPIGWS